MRNIIYILILFLFVSPGTEAQKTTRNNIRFKQFTVNKGDNLVKIDLEINLDDLKLGTSDMVTLTPILRTRDLRHQHMVDPIIITGKQRKITLQRAIDFEGYAFRSTPQGIFRRYNKKRQSIDMSIHAVYEAWMDKADLIFVESLACCGLTTETNSEYKVLSPLFEKRPVASGEYRLSYITPPVETVKQRSETYSAKLHFTVGKDKVEPHLDNNAELLDEIDNIIRNIQGNKNLSDIEFKIVGYASPEGDHLKNMQLSQDRSKAFAYYLTEKYDVPASSIKQDWAGDDWAGLYQAVDSSDMPYKSQTLKALKTLDPARRKSKLKKVAGGKAYTILLRDFFPKLRRNDYTISYVAKNFNLAEAKEQLKKNPHHLSLNEMFLVANSYPQSSREFKEVLGIAAQIYPNDPVARQYAAIMDIDNNDFDKAIERLEHMDSAEAYNNLGVAYAKKGELDTAMEYFDEAIIHNNKEAIENKKIAENY